MPDQPAEPNDPTVEQCAHEIARLRAALGECERATEAFRDKLTTCIAEKFLVCTQLGITADDDPLAALARYTSEAELRGAAGIIDWYAGNIHHHTTRQHVAELRAELGRRRTVAQLANRS